MVWPASTATLTVTRPANGAAMCAGLVRSAFSAVGIALAAITNDDGAQLAVDDAHHRAPPALVGIGDGLQADDEFDAAFELYPVFVVVAQPIEELVGGQADVSPYSSRCASNSLVGPGNSSRFSVRRGAMGQGGPSSPRTTRSSPALVTRPARASPCLERNGSAPAAGRVTQVAVQEADHRVGDVVACGVSASNSAVGIPAPTTASARSPTTFADGVTLTSLPRIRSAPA